MRSLAALAALVVPFVATPVAATETRDFHLPGGALSANIAPLSRQADISISVTQPDLWDRPVQPVKGRMSVDRALDRLLKGSGARAARVSDTGWRIEPSAYPTRIHKPVRGAPPAAASRARHTMIARAEDEIIVTASKADVPLALYAGTATLIGGEDIGFGGERGMDSVLRHAATLSSTHLGSGRNKLFIRGIADSSFTGPTQSTVGQYLGDIRLSYNAPDPDLRLYDLDGVEVIEGAQGTLYGAGSLGGIIRLVPRAPDPDHSELQAIAGATVTQHGQPGGDIAAIANVPLGQYTLGGGHALRIVGYMLSEGGYIDNGLTGREDVNRTHIYGSRASLRLQPGEQLTIDVGGIYQQIRSDDAQYADRGGDGLTRHSPIEQGAQARYAMASLILTHEQGDLLWQSSNAYITHKLSERFDASVDADSPRVMNQYNNTRMWVSEARLSRPFRDGLGWVMGISFIDNHARQLRKNEAGLFRTPLNGVSNAVQEFTAYGNLTYAITPDLIASGGLRLSHSRLDGEGEDVPDSIALAVTARAITASRKESDFLPSASLLYNASENLRFYASYGEGFRPGGLAIASDFVKRFQHDRVKTWETGIRYGDRKHAPVDATLSLSHSRWTNIQADFIDASGFPSTENIGNGRITTLSGALAVRATPAITLELGGVYNYSRVTENIVQPSGTSGLADRAPERLGRIPNVARYSLRGSATYAVPLGQRDFRLHGWAQYIGPSRLGIGPVLGEEQGKYLDSGVAMRLGDETHGLSLTITNPFDVRGNRFAMGTPFSNLSEGFITPLRPRSLRIAVDVAY